MSDATPPIISLHDIHKRYLERIILDAVSFPVTEGERIGLLGANGAGKSTLLGIIAGKHPADGGEVRMRRGIKVSYLDQEGGLRDDWTVRQTIDAAFADLHELEREIDRIHTALEGDVQEPDLTRMIERQHVLQEIIDRRDPHTIESRTQRAMSALGVPPPDRLLGELSGGERRRTALCRTLLEDADLLLLDEPTNHLDAETLDWLEDFLDRFRGTVIFVTHDRYFLDRVATTMVELWRGHTKIYAGNYTDYLMAKQEEAERADRQEATRQNLMRREIDWLRRQPRARTTKSKSRMDRAHALIADAPPPPDSSLKLLIPSGPRLGKTLVEAEKLRYAIAGRTLINDFTLQLGAGDRIGIVGRNGLGKTTLLRLLLKEIEPQGGKVTHGPSVKFVYGDQNRRALDLDKTALEEVAGDLEYVQCGEQRIGFRAWLKMYQFDDSTAAMPIRLLSGGERNRVLLAKMMREGGNIVVLDEPTNDLDLPTLRVLEESLAQFDGCAFIVSHDRYFLNRVATKILAFRGDGRIDIITGNYDDYRRYLDKEEEARATATVASKAAHQEAAKTSPATAPAPAKKRLSFNEQRELATIEERIAAAEKLVADCDAKLEDPNLYTARTKEEVQKLLAEAAKARAEVDKLMDRWTELGERA